MLNGAGRFVRLAGVSKKGFLCEIRGEFGVPYRLGQIGLEFPAMVPEQPFKIFPQNNDPTRPANTCFFPVDEDINLNDNHSQY